MRTVTIEQPPADYYSWSACIKKLKSGIPDVRAFEVLRRGSCPEYIGVRTSFHEQIQDAVNAIIATCIRELKRDMRRFAESGETDGFHIAFQRFGKRINGCMFFTAIPFLEQEFSDELRRETVRQVTLFWAELLHQIKKETASRNNLKMSEEFLLIKRVRLLQEYQISG